MKLPPVGALKGLLLPVTAAVAIYWLRFAPVPGVAPTVATADVTGETMGTGNLAARLAASLVESRSAVGRPPLYRPRRDQIF